MKSIKNKTTYKAKFLLTILNSSSLLILKASNTDCWGIRSTLHKNQKFINQTTIDHPIPKANKLVTIKTYKTDQTSTTQRTVKKKSINNYQNREDLETRNISNYEKEHESGYESDCQEAIYKPPLYYRKEYNKICEKTNNTTIPQTHRDKDNSSLEIIKDEVSPIHLEPSNNNYTEINSTITAEEKNENKKNDYQDQEKNSDQGYGSISNLSNNYSSDIEESTYEELENNSCLCKDLEDNRSASYNSNDIYENPEDYNQPLNNGMASNLDNNIPFTKREATNPIQLITDDFITIVNNVDARMRIKLNFINYLIEIEKLVNEMVALRIEPDHYLTDEQKKSLSTIKTKIKAPNSSFNSVIYLYEDLNISLISIQKKDTKEKIKNLKKEIKAIWKDVKKLRSSILYTDL